MIRTLDLAARALPSLPCLAVLVAFAACGDDADTRPGAGTDAGPTPDGGPVATGEPCTRDATCGDGLVCARDGEGADLAPLALRCAAVEAGDEGEECASSSDCGRGICLLAGTCAKPCESDDDCGEGDWCTDLYARTADDVFQPVRACIPVFSGPDDVTVTRTFPDLELAGDVEGQDTLEIPAGPATTLVALLSDTPEADPFFVRLRTAEEPSELLFDFDTLNPDTPAPDMGVNPGTGVMTLLVPNGPNAPTPAPGFVAEIASAAPARLEVRTLTRTEQGSVLDLHIYFVGGMDWSAGEGGALPAALQAAVDEFETVYGAAGITLGEVRTHQIGGGLLERYRDIENGLAGPDIRELFALSGGAKGPGINWFFVRDLGGPLGLTGGIPAPQGMHGTESSGIAFDADLALSQDRLGAILVHETGHFMGLFHTSELRGLVVEPLPDTPECRLEEDENDNGLLEPSECAGLDADNRMHWAVFGEEPFTEQQAAVLRSAILLR